jgi:hypothetical protein
MAKTGAPYLHPKMQATAPSMDDGSPLVPVINLISIVGQPIPSPKAISRQR